MGHLFHKIGATLTEQNKADIAASLESKAMDADMARKHVDILEYIAEGGELSDVQMKMVEKNDVLAQTLREVVMDPNSTLHSEPGGFL